MQGYISADPEYVQSIYSSISQPKTLSNDIKSFVYTNKLEGYENLLAIEQLMETADPAVLFPSQVSALNNDTNPTNFVIGYNNLLITGGSDSKLHVLAEGGSSTHEVKSYNLPK